MTGFSVYWDDKIIVLKDEELIVAVMSYRGLKHLNSNSVSLAYISEGYRSKGLYPLLYNKLKEITKADGLKYVTSGTHINNIEAQKALQKVGRTITGYDYRDEV